MKSRWGALTPDEAKTPPIKMTALIQSIIEYGGLMENVGRYKSTALAAKFKKDREQERSNFTFMFSAQERATKLLRRLSDEFGCCPCDLKLIGAVDAHIEEVDDADVEADEGRGTE